MEKKLKTHIGLFIFVILFYWILMVMLFALKSNFFEEKDFFTLLRERYTTYGGDSQHYMYIAENGYQASGEKANLIVFYPLYPLLIRIVATVIHDYFWAGIIVSNISLGLAVCFLYELMVLLLDKEKALDGLAMFLLFPVWFFLVLVFSESLFIMLSSASLLFTKKKKWLLAGVFGMLASLSRTQGIVLLLPALYEIALDIKSKKKFTIKYLFILLIPLGIMIYFLINKVVQGNYFAFLEHQAAPPWYNSAKWITQNISKHYQIAMKTHDWAWSTYWVQFFLYFIGVGAMFYGIHKKVDTSIIAYGGAYIFVSYLHGWLISGARYMMACIPLYIVFASIENKYIKKVLLVAEGILAIAYTYASIKKYSIV